MCRFSGRLSFHDFIASVTLLLVQPSYVMKKGNDRITYIVHHMTDFDYLYFVYIYDWYTKIKFLKQDVKVDEKSRTQFEDFIACTKIYMKWLSIYLSFMQIKHELDFCQNLVLLRNRNTHMKKIFTSKIR